MTSPISAALLVVVGLINLYPIIGVWSAEQLAALYGTAIDDTNLLILMRHRAVLFGLLGGFIILSAFRPALQLLACIAGLVSMLAFIGLAFSAGDFGEDLQKVVVVDVLASIALAVVLVLRRWPGARASGPT